MKLQRDLVYELQHMEQYCQRAKRYHVGADCPPCSTHSVILTRSRCACSTSTLEVTGSEREAAAKENTIMKVRTWQQSLP